MLFQYKALILVMLASQIQLEWKAKHNQAVIILLVASVALICDLIFSEMKFK